MLLPSRDELPYEPVPAAVVKTYRPGLWFEGIARGHDGMLYLAGSISLDDTTGRASQVQGQVIARSRDGSERTHVMPPAGSTAGVTAVGADGRMFMAVTGAARGLWRVEPDGTGQLLAPTPPGSWPNGVSFGPGGADAKIYLADSSLGVIWIIDPATGSIGRAYEGTDLRPRPGAFAPGANGIQLFGNQMYVTNSDAGTLLRFDVDTNGNLRNPHVTVTGVPADDFSFDHDGTVYLTTHIFDTVVRVDPDGRRAVIAGAAEHVTGATDCVLVDDGTGRVLYVVTDGGGLASGDRAAAGTLVALTVTAPMHPGR